MITTKSIHNYMEKTKEIMLKKVQYAISKLIYSEGMSPLPWKPFIATFFLQLINMTQNSLVLSFLPKLVKSFGISEADSGYYIGLMLAVFPFGRIFSSFFWGLATDRFPKKYLALFCAFTTATTGLMFGFTNNYVYGIVTRFLQSTSYGMMTINKAYLVDVTDNTNFGLAMSILMTSYTIGLTVGKTIGGLLSFPVEAHPDVFGSVTFFRKFPVILPYIFTATLFGLASILSCFWLVDTSKVHSSKRSSEGNDYKAMHSSEEQTYEIHDKGNDTKMMELQKKTGIKSLFRNKNLVLISIIFFTNCMLTFGFDEVYPMFAATSRKYKGFGFSPKDIGLSIIVPGVVTLILQFLLFPKTIIFCCTCQAFLYVLIPLLESVKSRTALWIFLIILLTTIRCMAAVAVTSIIVLINKTVEKHLIGSANGLANVFAVVGRTCSGITFGSIFSWSLRNIKGIDDNKSPLGFPFNQYFLFIVLSTISLVNAILTHKFPNYLDNHT